MLRAAIASRCAPALRVRAGVRALGTPTCGAGLLGWWGGRLSWAPSLASSAALPLQQQVRHASKKAGGSTNNGRDSIGRRLGVKLFGGERVKPGQIIVRQRGTKWFPGPNIHMGKDHTLHSLIDGHVMYTKHQVVKKASKRTSMKPHVVKVKTKTMVYVRPLDFGEYKPLPWNTPSKKGLTRAAKREALHHKQLQRSASST